MEKQGKWEFLRTRVEELKQNKSLSHVQIAKQIMEEYGFAGEVETYRKIVSLLVNGTKNWGKKETPQVNYVQFSDFKQPKEVIFTDPREISRLVKEQEQKPVIHTKINKPGNYLVLGCWHVPFHNDELTKRVYDLIDTHDFQGLILNGDFLDMNSLSGHDRGKFTAIPGLDLNQEYKAGKRVLDNLIALLPSDAEKVYMYGNHENRWQRFIADMQNAKTPPISPTEGLGLYDRGFTVVEDYGAGYITLGQHLDIIHGIYYSTHCAKAHIDRFRSSILFAHTHRIQSYIEGRTGGFNIGWGGDVTHRAFGYADRGTKASWQNGFAIVTIDDQGRFFTQQIVCNDSRFVYGGKQY
jgi:hypothetical protein